MSETQFTIGKLLTKEQHRDAIHIAVMPVIAAERLSPGQHVGFHGKPSQGVMGSARPPIGIVDPFLTGAVCAGERFWMFLYPNTITSLRHEWTHPALHAEPYNPAISEDEKWLRQFATDADITYEGLLDGAKAYLEHGSYLCEGGKWEGFMTPPEFWTHYEAVAGVKVSEDDRGSFFTCSC
jgi:hypothetical protein